MPTARNSDCQFCSVSSQKSGPRHVRDPRDGRIAVLLLPLVVLVHAVERLHGPAREEDRRHGEHQRVRVEPGPPATDLGPPGRIFLDGVADQLVLVGLAAGLLRFLRLGRAALHQPHRRQDVERELQELRLPVLQHRLPKVGGDQVARVRDRVASVLHLLLVVDANPDERLPDDRSEEDAAEEQCERVLPYESPHRDPSLEEVRLPAGVGNTHRYPITPTTAYAAIPATITTQ